MRGRKCKHPCSQLWEQGPGDEGPGDEGPALLPPTRPAQKQAESALTDPAIASLKSVRLKHVTPPVLTLEAPLQGKLYVLKLLG